MELNSVKDFFMKNETVEKYNGSKIRKLKWKYPDVLFSFRGIYAIGIFIYYREKFADNTKIDIIVKEKESVSRQRLYSDKYLRENYQEFDCVNSLPEMKKFLKHYYDIGNVIEAWPGANVNIGMSHCYDIPNVYYKRHFEFTKIIYGEIYSNVFIEQILENNKYDTVEKLLKMQPKQYREFLDYIVKVISSRSKQLNNLL